MFFGYDFLGFLVFPMNLPHYLMNPKYSLQKYLEATKVIFKGVQGTLHLSPKLSDKYQNQNCCDVTAR